MKYLAMSVLLLALPAQAANNASSLNTQECLQLIRDYWTEFDKSGKEPVDLFDKFGAQCDSTKELDNLMLKDDYINGIIDKLTKKGVL